MEDIKVSICYITYNQEAYIKDAMDSFLRQERDFSIEILIHDDASTDKTVEILKDYESKYPNIIKPIYNQENQFSKGVQIHNINIQRARGQYIALCDGDDYWIDPYKLQKQVDYMDNNPDCTFCFTNARIIDQAGGSKERRFIPYSDIAADFFDDRSKRYDVAQLALLDFIPTASYFFRTDSRERFPDFYYDKFPTEDIKISLLLTSQGYAYYINDDTTVYRENVPGSLMSQWKYHDQEELLIHNQGFIDLLKLIDQYNDYKYHEELSRVITPRKLGKALAIGDRAILKDKDIRSFLKTRSLKYRTKAYLSLYLPKTYHLLKDKMQKRRLDSI